MRHVDVQRWLGDVLDLLEGIGKRRDRVYQVRREGPLLADLVSTSGDQTVVNSSGQIGLALPDETSYSVATGSFSGITPNGSSATVYSSDTAVQ